MIMKQVWLSLTFVIVIAFAGAAGAQETSPRLTIGLYAPVIGFRTAAERLQYVQGLAAEIEKATGVPTTGKSFARFSDLLRERPHFAIVDGVCATTRSLGTVLLSAAIDGETEESWGLFSTQVQSFQELEGQKIASVGRGCADMAFLAHAMLRSEVPLSFFAGVVRKPTIDGAVAAVASYKEAAAVFAPERLGRGMRRLFIAGAVPTPVLIQMSRRVGDVAPKVARVVSASQLGRASGWRTPGPLMGSFADRLKRRTKSVLWVRPKREYLNFGDLIIFPGFDAKFVSVSHLFEEPPR